MPLKKGTSDAVLSQNISEFHQGQTYERTKKKFGKKTADKQAIAAAFNERRSSAASAHREATRK